MDRGHDPSQRTRSDRANIYHAAFQLVWGPDQARYLDFDLDISVGKITRAPTEITRYGRYLGSDPRYLGPGKISRFGP